MLLFSCSSIDYLLKAHSSAKSQKGARRC